MRTDPEIRLTGNQIQFTPSAPPEVLPISTSKKEPFSQKSVVYLRGRHFRLPEIQDELSIESRQIVYNFKTRVT